MFCNYVHLFIVKIYNQIEDAVLRTCFLDRAYKVPQDIREVKHDVYGKRQTAKMKLLPSVFSSLYSRIKIFLLAVNSKRQVSIFVRFI